MRDGGNDSLLIAIAAVVGCLSGGLVALMSFAAQYAHVLIYGIELDVHLSANASINPIAALIAPAAGGLLLGVMEWWRGRLGIANAIDPVEANALRGGKMSLRDSLIVSTQTLISNGCGASVGLEAGYTQICAGISSLCGGRLNLGRNDLRLMVGCGAAGAIAAAFNAPLTGTFYACELIIGTYSVGRAAPILVSSFAAALVAGHIGGAPYSLKIPPIVLGSLRQAAALIVLAVISGLIGIGTMRLAALAERILNWMRLAVWLKPILGGLCVGGMALVTPQVLAAGHGAMILDMNRAMPLLLIATIVALKLLACTLSLASGFRGGLFFASLFIGSLIGKFYGDMFGALGPTFALNLDPTSAVLTGMATLGVAIVGGPLSMTFLVLEMTHDFQVTATVLAASMVTSALVRRLFGHSFSTWRLHLRGVTLRGGEDVGWLRGLTVSSMMRTDPVVVRTNTTVAECRRRFQLGSHRAIFVVDENDAYRGIVPLPDVFAEAEDRAERVAMSALARYPDTTLVGSMNVTSAMRSFEEAGIDILAVIDHEGGNAIVGFLSEAYARRRYIEEQNGATASLVLKAS